MTVLDVLVDAAVTASEIRRGVSVPVVASRSSLGTRAQVVLRRAWPAALRRNAGRWSPEEKECVRVCLGRASLEEIGLALGRTPMALRLLRKREGWPAPSKVPDQLTANQAGRLLGVDPKLVTRLIDLGVLPGRVLPNGRNIHVVARMRLECWMISPRNWIYFHADRVRDVRLRRLVQLAQSRWPDRWLTTRQAAAIIGCRHWDVNRWIHMGRLPAVRWNNWRILESVARRTVIPRGRGTGGKLRTWSDRADAFLVLARAGRLSWSVIGRLMGPAYSQRRGPSRFAWLVRRGQIPALIARHRLPVVCDGAGVHPGPGFRPRWRVR